MSELKLNAKIEDYKKAGLRQSGTGKTTESEPISFNSGKSSAATVHTEVSELEARKEQKSVVVDNKQGTVDSLQSEVEELQSGSETAQQEANTAQQTAQTAQTNASNLAQTAQEAQANASNLASVAASTPQTIEQEVIGEDGEPTTQQIPNPAYEAAQQAANAAQEIANQAQAEADTAQQEADEAQKAADDALQAADEAKSQLETKQQELENEKTELEQSKAELQQIEEELSAAQKNAKEDEEISSQVEEAQNEENKEYTYDELIEQLQGFGIKATSLADGETNFAEYGKALTKDVQDILLDSFDTPEDYELQQKLAGLYTDRSNMTTDEFIASCKAMGLDVSSDWVQTTYLVDAKATGGGKANGNVGAITVLTIVDPSTGAEIKIADTNGNGAIEVEELFMNQLLQKVSIEIDKDSLKAAVKGVSASSLSEAQTEARKAAEKYESLVERDEDGNIVEDKREATISVADKLEMINKLQAEFLKVPGTSFIEASTRAAEIVENNYKVSPDAENMSSSSIQSAVSKLSKEK